MKPSRCPSCFAVVVVVVVLTSALLLPPLSRAAETDESSSAPVLVLTGLNIDFPGGTVGQLVDLLKKDRNQNFNLIVSGAQRDLTLPGFSVRNANPWSLVEALNTFLQDKNVQIIARRDLAAAGAEPVFTLTSIENNRTTPSGAFLSYPLKALLEHYSADQIADALRVAWELDSTQDPAALKLKFHPETSLLFVVGPDRRSITVVESVIKNLERQANEMISQAERDRRIQEEIARRRAQRRSTLEEPTPQTPAESGTPGPSPQ